MKNQTKQLTKRRISIFQRLSRPVKIPKSRKPYNIYILPVRRRRRSLRGSKFNNPKW